MRKRKKDAAETLFGIIQETEALAEEQPSNDINVLNELLTQFLSRDKVADNLEKQAIKRDWLAGATLTISADQARIFTGNWILSGRRAC